MKCFRSAAATLVLLAAQAAWAEPPKVTIPADQLKPVNGYVRFTPGGDAKAVTYVALSGVFPFPAEELKDPRRFVLPAAGLRAGRYEFVAVGSLNDEHTSVPFAVVIGEPGPGPGPGPTPVPPDTDPKTDPLFSPVAAAYGADVSGTKAADRAKLAAVYRSVAAKAVPDARVRTAGDLAEVIASARRAELADRLAAVRDILGGDFETAVPSDPAAALTAGQKAEAAKRLNRYAAVLEALN